MHEALALQPSERAAFLAQAGQNDADLAREVESMLAAHDQVGSFLETPAFAEATWFRF